MVKELLVVEVVEQQELVYHLKLLTGQVVLAVLVLLIIIGQVQTQHMLEVVVDQLGQEWNMVVLVQEAQAVLVAVEMVVVD